MEAILRGLDVVRDSAETDHFLFRVANDVAGTRVVVTRLADTADVDHVAGARLEPDQILARTGALDPFAGHFPDCGDMGVPVKYEPGTLAIERSFGVLFIVDVGETAGSIWGRVNEHHPVILNADGTSASRADP